MDKIIWDVERFDTLPSTNSALREIADTAPEGKAYIALAQTGGRGTKGRSFSSRKGGFYASFLLKPRSEGFAVTEITALTAVAVSRAIESVFEEKVGIKWVNDLIFKGKKVAGILVEGRMSEGRCEWVIVGVGVNLCIPEGGFPEELREIAGSLRESVSEEERILFESAFFEQFNALYLTCESGAYKREYKERSVLLGKDVTVKAGEESFTGVAVDIDGENRLILKKGCEEIAFCSGEVIKIEY